MRIITGTARGCRLKTPKGQGTRPTADRIKESLFNILGNRVWDQQVLDAFAGTGALGLEALSRGAARAVFIDQATAGLIRENAEHTHLLERSEILRGDVFAALQRLAQQGRQFGIIFCDPPYHKGLWERALQFFDQSSLAAPGSLVIIEHGRDENTFPPLQKLEQLRNQSYGSTTQLTIFQKPGGEEQ